MSDGLTYLGLIVGSAFILVAGSRLAIGSPDLFAGLFPAHGIRDWPTGVQEGDAPHFDVGHLDGLRPGHADLTETSEVRPADVLSTELIDLGSRGLSRRSA